MGKLNPRNWKSIVVIIQHSKVKPYVLGCLGRGGSNPAVSECVCVASVGLLIELFRSLVVCKNGRGRGSFHQVDNCHVLLGKHVGEGGVFIHKNVLCALVLSPEQRVERILLLQMFRTPVHRQKQHKQAPPSLPPSLSLST